VLVINHSWKCIFYKRVINKTNNDIRSQLAAYWAAALSATAEGTFVADTYLWKNLWEPYHTSTYISVLQIDDRDYLYLKIICAGRATHTDTSRSSVPKLRALQRYLVYLCQNTLVAYIHLDNLCICTYPVHIHLD
jgi:hypothetical protein